MGFTNIQKDIQISPSSNGYFDYNFFNGDFVSIDGLNALTNSLILKLMTLFGEMKNNPLYSQWGNHASENLKSVNTMLTREKIKEDFTLAITETYGVKSLDNITVDYDPTPPGGVNVIFNFTALDDNISTVQVSL
jgi:hypothetical protein